VPEHQAGAFLLQMEQALRPGDLAVVFQSGAYGLSASPRAFLSQGDAVEVLV